MSLELRLKALTQRIGTEIKTIQAASDVVDVVGTKAALNSYDLSKLTDQDVVKVLADETLSDAQAYYRITKTSASTGSWALVGSIAKFNFRPATTETLGGIKLMRGVVNKLYAVGSYQIVGSEKPYNEQPQYFYTTTEPSGYQDVTFDQAGTIRFYFWNAVPTVVLNGPSEAHSEVREEQFERIDDTYLSTHYGQYQFQYGAETKDVEITSSDPIYNKYIVVMAGDDAQYFNPHLRNPAEDILLNSSGLPVGWYPISVSTKDNTTVYASRANDSTYSYEDSMNPEMSIENALDWDDPVKIMDVNGCDTHFSSMNTNYYNKQGTLYTVIDGSNCYYDTIGSAVQDDSSASLPLGAVQLDQNNCAYVDLSQKAEKSELGNTEVDLVDLFEQALE